MTRLELDGRVVAITGGARGIGLAVGRAARARGARVVLLDRDAAEVAARAEELGAGGSAVDVTDADAVADAFGAVAARFGGIDVVVANAGIGPIATTIDAGDREHQRRVLDVNLHGVWHTAWAGAPLVAARKGHFVVMSSIAAFLLTPAWAAYAAAKAGVEALARSMRVELAPTGASVGVTHFGLVTTALVEEFERDPLVRRIERIFGRAMLRHCSPEDAAGALVRGIEHRAPRTIYPARWRIPYALRGLIGPLSDGLLNRDPRVRRLMAEIRERDRSLDPLTGVDRQPLAVPEVAGRD